MAKKKVSKKKPSLPRDRDKQTRIPGTFDKVPKEVQEASDEYADLLYERQAIQARENDQRLIVIKLMHEHKLQTFKVLEGEVTLSLLPGGEKLKLKKNKETAA